MEVVSYHNWSEFVYIDSWGFVVLGLLKRLIEGIVLQNWPLYLVNVIKAAIISEHPRYVGPIRALEKKRRRHGLPVHRFYHVAFASKQWNGAETALGLRYRDCRLFQMQIVAKKILSQGQNRRVGRVFRNKITEKQVRCIFDENLEMIFDISLWKYILQVLILIASLQINVVYTLKNRLCVQF